jgi:uncharacterized protein YuzE
MRWTFDLEAHAFYVYLNDAPPVRQQVVSDGVIVDVGAAGEIVGVELLSFPAPLPRGALAQLGVDEQALLLLSYLAATPMPSLWGADALANMVRGDERPDTIKLRPDDVYA